MLRVDDEDVEGEGDDGGDSSADDADVAVDRVDADVGAGLDTVRIDSDDEEFC
jgi:hypothetical protein